MTGIRPVSYDSGEIRLRPLVTMAGRDGRHDNKEAVFEVSPTVYTETWRVRRRRDRAIPPGGAKAHAGATETGRPYFMMELVKGVPVTEYRDKNNLSTKDRLNLFMPVCNAIQRARQEGTIHRDFKPTNAMVTLHDGVPAPRVIDLGIAKTTNNRLTEKTLFTAFNQFAGTPAYVSPEQAKMSGS